MSGLRVPLEPAQPVGLQRPALLLQLELLQQLELIFLQLIVLLLAELRRQHRRQRRWWRRWRQLGCIRPRRRAEAGAVTETEADPGAGATAGRATPQRGCKPRVV